MYPGFFKIRNGKVTDMRQLFLKEKFIIVPKRRGQATPPRGSAWTSKEQRNKGNQTLGFFSKFRIGQFDSFLWALGYRGDP